MNLRDRVKSYFDRLAISGIPTFWGNVQYNNMFRFMMLEMFKNSSSEDVLPSKKPRPASLNSTQIVLFYVYLISVGVSVFVFVLEWKFNSFQVHVNVSAVNEL